MEAMEEILVRITELKAEVETVTTAHHAAGLWAKIQQEITRAKATARESVRLDPGVGSIIKEMLGKIMNLGDEIGARLTEIQAGIPVGDAQHRQEQAHGEESLPSLQPSSSEVTGDPQRLPQDIPGGEHEETPQGGGIPRRILPLLSRKTRNILSTNPSLL